MLFVPLPVTATPPTVAVRVPTLQLRLSVQLPPLPAANVSVIVTPVRSSTLELVMFPEAGPAMIGAVVPVFCEPETPSPVVVLAAAVEVVRVVDTDVPAELMVCTCRSYDVEAASPVMVSLVPTICPPNG